jgi:2'-5' RNA ligase
MTTDDEHGNDAAFDEPERFRSLRSLTNHWSRPIGPPAYYWYLTFEHSAELQSLAERCQQAIAFPYYDLTPISELHLTLDRIAFEGQITREQLDAIEAAARLACRNEPPFQIMISLLGGVSGAIGFTAFPEQPIRHLRDTVRAATLSICPDASVRQASFHPHIAIGYANTDGVPAADVIAAVDKLNASAARVQILVDHVSLVRLERVARSYAWQTVSRIVLSGSERLGSLRLATLL